MNTNYLSFTQKTFPFIRRHVEVDVELQKIRVFYETLFVKQVFTVDLYDVDENARSISKKFLGWRIFSMVLSLYVGFQVIMCMLSFINKFDGWVLTDMFFYMSLGLLSWSYYFKRKGGNQRVYFSRLNAEEPLFSLYTDIGDKKAYQAFILRLEEILTDFKKGRSLNLMLKKMPVQILLDEFRTSYLEELLKRGVNVVDFLESLNKQFFENEYLPEKRSVN